MGKQRRCVFRVRPQAVNPRSGAPPGLGVGTVDIETGEYGEAAGGALEGGGTVSVSKVGLIPNTVRARARATHIKGPPDIESQNQHSQRSEGV